MEQQETKIENLNEYVNRETGLVLTNSVDINYYKCIQNDEILNNLLLGKFTKDGKYLLDKEYLIELVKIKKYIDESSDNKYILKAPLKDYELRFTLTIETLEDGKKSAALRFIEISKKESGEKEILKTLVAKYKDDNDLYFIEKAFKVFNIIKKEEISGDDIDEEELANILRRIKEMAYLKSKRVESLDYISNTYVDEILAVLKKNPGKFSDYILRKYAEKLEGFKDFIGKPGYFIKIKILLDSLLANASSENRDNVILDSINKVRENYIINYKTIHKEILNEANAVKIPKKPVQDNVAPKRASSSGGGSKKKGNVKSKSATVSKAKKSAKTQQYYYRPKPLFSQTASDKTHGKKNENEEPKIEKVEKTINLIGNTFIGLMQKNRVDIKKKISTTSEHEMQL